MDRFKGPLAAVAGLIVLAAAFSGFGTPALAGPPPGTQPAQNVNVVNIAKVLNINEAAQPYRSQQQTLFTPDVSNAFVNFGAVPAGKRLVIEHVGVTIIVGSDVQVLAALLVDEGDPNQASVRFPLIAIPQITTFGTTYAATQPMRVYVNAGETLFIEASRDNAGFSGSIQGVVSGYLVDVP